MLARVCQLFFEKKIEELRFFLKIGSFDIEDKASDNLAEVSSREVNKENLSINTNLLHIDQSDSIAAIDFSSITPTAATTTYHVDLVSSLTTNIKVHRGVKNSL